MKYTQNLNMKIPEGGDPIDIADITGNFETLDIEINKKANTSGGDISDTTIKTVDAIATEFPVPSAGESSKTFLGKVRKFIQDFIAIKDTLLTLSKLVNNGQTTNSGFALDARYGKTLADQITKLNTDLTNKLNNTGGTLTGNLTLQKDTPIYEAMVSSTLKGRFIKNAGAGIDYGTELIDISGNVQTNLTVTNGKLRLVKRVDGVITGTADVASIP